MSRRKQEALQFDIDGEAWTVDITCRRPLLTTGFVLQSPEIQSMYSLGMPVSAIRTKIRQEFERHRYVNQLQTVDVLLTQSHAEFQV